MRNAEEAPHFSTVSGCGFDSRCRLITPVFHLANLFARTEKKQLDWLATNTDVITSQSHSLSACSREQIRQVENRLYVCEKSQRSTESRKKFLPDTAVSSHREC